MNGLISTYKYILANSETQEGQQKYRQILYFAELCKEEYSAKIVQDSVESGNNQQVQDLLADDATRPDIIDGMINYAQGADNRVAGLNGDAESYFDSFSPLLDIMDNPDYAKDLDEALSNRDYAFGDLHQAAFKDLLSASSMYRDGELTEAERSELESLAGYYNDRYNDLVNDKSVGFDNFGEGSLRDFYRNVSASLNKAAQAGDITEATQYLQEGFEDINTENIQARLAATGAAGVLAGINRGVGVGDKIKITYHPRIRQRGVEDPKYHNFPYSMDKKILSVKPIKQQDGSLLYQKSGFVNGKQGNYEIVLNPKTGVIFHRQFKPNK